MKYNPKLSIYLKHNMGRLDILKKTDIQLQNIYHSMKS